jgi:hypothetical protein
MTRLATVAPPALFPLKETIYERPIRFRKRGTTWPELEKQRRAIDGKPDDFEA